MDIFLRLTIIVVCLFFMLLIFRQVNSGRLLLRYSLLWLLLALVALLMAIFPEPVFSLAAFLGFNTPSNFVFFAALFFNIIISLSLSVVISRQSSKLKTAIQSIAILEHELEEVREGAELKDRADQK